MSLALCLQVVSQAPQHFRSSETQAPCNGCFSRQSICPVISLHSGMSRAVHRPESSKIMLLLLIIIIIQEILFFLKSKFSLGLPVSPSLCVSVSVSLCVSLSLSLSLHAHQSRHRLQEGQVLLLGRRLCGHQHHEGHPHIVFRPSRDRAVQETYSVTMRHQHN